MPTWCEAFSHWATTCESVFGYNAGAKQKRHRRSFANGRGPTRLSAKLGGIEREIAVIFALTHSTRDLIDAPLLSITMTAHNHNFTSKLQITRIINFRTTKHKPSSSITSFLGTQLAS